MLSYDKEPALSTAEIDELVSIAKRADHDSNAPDAYTYWRLSTAYAAGAKVVPTTRNGHVYTASAGTSGTTEPTWPTASGAAVVNGGVTFTEAGSLYWAPIWDLNYAAAEGWRWKQAKVAHMIEFIGDGHRFFQDQLTDHCEKMVAMYSKRVSGTLAVPGIPGIPRIPSFNVGD